MSYVLQCILCMKQEETIRYSNNLLRFAPHDDEAPSYVHVVRLTGMCMQWHI